MRAVDIFVLAALSAALLAMQSKPKGHSPVDVRFGQRTVLVADSDKKTLTITPGDQAMDIWVCAPHDGGKSCKEAQMVLDWLLANGVDH